jgi:mycofactocin precursor
MQEPSERPSSTTPADAVDTVAAIAPVGTLEVEAAGLEPSDEEEDAELEELLIREITIDGMCGVY